MLRLQDSNLHAQGVLQCTHVYVLYNTRCCLPQPRYLYFMGAFPIQEGIPQEPINKTLYHYHQAASACRHTSRSHLLFESTRQMN